MDTYSNHIKFELDALTTEGKSRDLVDFAHILLKSVKELGYPTLVVSEQSSDYMKKALDSLGLAKYIDSYATLKSDEPNTHIVNIINQFSLPILLGKVILSVVRSSDAE